MHWFDWVLIIILGLSLLLNIRSVGKETKAMSPTSLMIQTIVVGLLIAGIIIFRG